MKSLTHYQIVTIENTPYVEVATDEEVLELANKHSLIVEWSGYADSPETAINCFNEQENIQFQEIVSKQHYMN